MHRRTLLAATAGAVATTARAQESWPGTRPVKVIYPGSPGSPVLFASCAARLLTLAADRLRESPVA